LFVWGYLFKVHTWALEGNKFPTLLFTTILMLKAKERKSIFSWYPSILFFVITGSVELEY
jgi:hypothetical protein